MSGGGAGAPEQLALRLGLRPGRTFENWVPGPNREPSARLREAVDEGAGGVVFLWGRRGTGKTHLLEACAARAAARGRALGYVPLAARAELRPAVLDGLGSRALVALDDLDRVAGEADWERAIFGLYLEAEARGALLAVSASAPPGALRIGLPDLASRLGAGLVFALRPLDDADRRRALATHAAARGLRLPDEVAEYILRRHPRDMGALVALVERLDRAALQAQRRLTVPFVREVLERG